MKFPLPCVIGNAFFDSTGRGTQLRLLEKLRFRLGLVTLDDLEKRYGSAGAVIDCSGSSPCSTCRNKAECGRTGCVRIAALAGEGRTP